jgi:ubiquitin-protein ligase E3 C
MLGVKFAGPFLNLLINNRNSFDDLLLIDPDLYRSLIFISEMEEGVEDLVLSFQYHDGLTKKLINLKPGGEKIRVTRENKAEYVNLLINYKVNRSMERQTRNIRKGLKSVINDNWIRMFNYAEFNYLLSGTGKIDVGDWMKHARVQGNNDQLISDFWNIVYEFEEEDKSLLLKFVTSCERPSFLGFKDLQPPFTIRVLQPDDNQLPASHTCSNVLDLPAYSNKKVMRDKLLYAIKSGAGFEMA